MTDPYATVPPADAVDAFDPDQLIGPDDILPGMAPQSGVTADVMGNRPAPAGQAEIIAQRFHEAYERLAPDHGYRTREASAKPWADVPVANKGLMVATVADLIGSGTITGEAAAPQKPEDISDGFHTMAELYEHQRALTAVLATIAAVDNESWRAKAHHPEDSPIFDGYFIVGIMLPGGPISYHYELKHWDDFAAVPIVAHGPKWDGHTPGDVVERLGQFAGLIASTIEAADYDLALIPREGR